MGWILFSITCGLLAVISIGMGAGWLVWVLVLLVILRCLVWL